MVISIHNPLGANTISSLNFKHLRYFHVIAREGSIKGACKKLGITQSALSGQLKQLEEFLGKPLFERKVRKLILNEAGKVALNYTTSIFTQADEMIKSIRLPNPQKLSVIRVGVLPSLSKTHIHEFIVPLWKEDSICVTIVERKLIDLIHDLEDGHLEVILSDRPTSPIGTQFKAFKLRTRKIIAVGSKKFEYVKDAFPQALDGLPLLHLTRHSQIRPDIDFFFEQKNITPKIVGEADDVALLRIAAEKGIGFTVLPQNTVQNSLNNGSLVQLGELKDINSDMWAIIKSGNDYNQTLKSVIKRFQSQEL